MPQGKMPFSMPASIFEEILSENINGDIFFLSHVDITLFVSVDSNDGNN